MNYIQEYIKLITKNGYKMMPSIKRWIDEFLTYVDKSSVILEIGSGIGRDANYIEKKGYEVLRTDHAKELIDYQFKKGKIVINKDISLIEKSNPKFKALYMSCVLNVLSPEETPIAFINCDLLLEEGGILAFNTPSTWNMDYIRSCLKNFTILSEKKDAWFNHIIAVKDSE